MRWNTICLKGQTINVCFILDLSILTRKQITPRQPAHPYHTPISSGPMINPHRQRSLSTNIVKTNTFPLNGPRGDPIYSNFLFMTLLCRSIGVFFLIHFSHNSTSSPSRYIHAYIYSSVHPTTFISLNSFYLFIYDCRILSSKHQS